MVVLSMLESMTKYGGVIDVVVVPEIKQVIEY